MMCGPALRPGWFAFKETNSRSHESPAQIGRRPDTGCLASDGKIWIAGGDLLMTWDGSQFSRVALKSGNGNLDLRALLCATDEVWIGTGKGVVRYTAGGENSTPRGTAQRTVRFFPWRRAATARSGWERATGSAAFERDQSKPTATAMGSRKIRFIGFLKIVKAACGVATKNGLNQFLEGAATRYSSSEGLPSNNPGPVFQDHQGILWAGSLDGGLSRFSGNGFTPLKALEKAAGFSSCRGH